MAPLSSYRLGGMLVLLVGYFCTTALAFSCLYLHPIRPSSAPQHLPWRARPIILQSTAEADEDTESASKTVSLNFHGDLTAASDPLPKGTTKADVASFLIKCETRNSLLSSAGTRQVEEVSASPELSASWTQCCNQDYGAENMPEPDDCILACDTTIQFPGLKMINRVYNGIKCAIDADSGIPVYSFFLIGEKKTVSGLLPVVFLFNKLTGAAKKGDSLQPTAVAKSICSVKENQDGDMVFNFDASIQIKVEFPALLLKLLPASKEKVEEQGSTSVAKTISKEIDGSTKFLYDSFMAARQPN